MAGCRVYFRNWVALNSRSKSADFGAPRPAPATLPAQFAHAAALAQPFRFVRVDFTAVGSDLYFSELTFSPGGGDPEENLYIGDMRQALGICEVEAG